MIEVDRPAPSTTKINTKDSFELCYLRHQYFRRAKYNPTEAEMQPYMYIVTNLTKNTFFTYINLFNSVGLQQDDVLNIGMVHLVSFLGLYSLDHLKEKFAEWELKFWINESKQPQEKDVLQKNKANFTMFFKQRMEDLVRVCRQKVRNIRGVASEEFQIFCGKSMPPKNPRSILRNFVELGYKKIDFAVFKSIRKKADVDHDATAFKFDDTWYIAVSIDPKGLELNDLMGSEYNPYNNLHNSQPDKIFEERELQQNLSVFESAFNKKSKMRKKVTLRNFIAKNKKVRQYKEEVRMAKKLLKSLGE